MANPMLEKLEVLFDAPRICVSLSRTGEPVSVTRMGSDGRVHSVIWQRPIQIEETPLTHVFEEQQHEALSARAKPEPLTATEAVAAGVGCAAPRPVSRDAGSFMSLLDYVTKSRGLQGAIAAAIGCHPVLVSQWANGVRPVPVERCPAIERATDGVVCCEELAPGKPWHRVPDDAWPHPDGRPLLDYAAQEG